MRTNHFRRSRSGQSFLSLVLLIGAIIAMIGVTIALFANAFVDSGYGYQASAQAEVVATSGAEDALIQLDRNAAFSSTGYSLPVGSSSATVSVTQNSPSANYINVSSTATISSHQRTIQIVLVKNATTSQVTVVSWQEVQ